MKLTAANVRTLAVPTGINEKTSNPFTDYTYYDDDVKGFGVRCKAEPAHAPMSCRGR